MILCKSSGKIAVSAELFSCCSFSNYAISSYNSMSGKSCWNINLLEFFFLFALSKITQQLVILPLYSNNSLNHKAINSFLIERVVNVFSSRFTVLFKTRILDWINCGSVKG